MQHKANLRSVNGINDALEDTWEMQQAGKIDGKAADARNTTLRSAIELNVKYPLKVLDLFVKARMKKIDIPEGMLPDLSHEKK